MKVHAQQSCGDYLKKNPAEKENVFLGGQSKWDQELLRFLGLGKKKILTL
jgi:hypothetical protein